MDSKWSMHILDHGIWMEVLIGRNVSGKSARMEIRLTLIAGNESKQRSPGNESAISLLE